VNIDGAQVPFFKFWVWCDSTEIRTQPTSTYGVRSIP